MRLALMFRHREDRRVPRVGLHARRVVDRQPRVIADVRARHALRLILVKNRSPDAVEIDLRVGATRRGERRRHHEHGGDDSVRDVHKNLSQGRLKPAPT
jgi:hypothetical protein